MSEAAVISAIQFLLPLEPAHRRHPLNLPSSSVLGAPGTLSLEARLEREQVPRSPEDARQSHLYLISSQFSFLGLSLLICEMRGLDQMS